MHIKEVYTQLALTVYINIFIYLLDFNDKINLNAFFYLLLTLILNCSIFIKKFFFTKYLLYN